VRGGEKEQKTEREKTAERMMDETLFWRGTEKQEIDGELRIGGALM
jgi:hypothetical protein